MKRGYLIKSALIAALLGSGPLQASMSWSRQLPPDAVAKKEEQGGGHGHGHGGHGGGGTPFYLSDAEGAEAEVWFPTLVRRGLTADEKGVVKVGGTGVNSYHLLYARKKSAGRDELALRYHSLRGKPTGESPALLVGYRKGVLDIVPSPLTREHARYLSGSEARYTLLFKNRPLANYPLSLTTSNGSTVQLKSDDKGRVVAMLPDDFRNVEPGRGANRPGEFVLRAVHSDEGIEYSTTISADYSVNPLNWRSQTGAVLVMLAGFVGGLVVVRRYNNKGADNA